jgi:hypothetical protein
MKGSVLSDIVQSFAPSPCLQFLSTKEKFDTEFGVMFVISRYLRRKLPKVISAPASSSGSHRFDSRLQDRVSGPRLSSSFPQSHQAVCKSRLPALHFTSVVNHFIINDQVQKRCEVTSIKKKKKKKKNLLKFITLMLSKQICFICLLFCSKQHFVAYYKKKAIELM